MSGMCRCPSTTAGVYHQPECWLYNQPGSVHVGETESYQTEIISLRQQLLTTQQALAAAQQRVTEVEEELRSTRTLLRIKTACLESAEKECESLRGRVTVVERERDEARFEIANADDPK